MPNGQHSTTSVNGKKGPYGIHESRTRENNLMSIQVKKAQGTIGSELNDQFQTTTFNPNSIYFTESQIREELSIHDNAEQMVNSTRNVYNNGYTIYGEKIQMVRQNDCSSLIIDLLHRSGMIKDREIEKTKTQGRSGQNLSFYTPNQIILDLNKKLKLPVFHKKGGANATNALNEMTATNAENYVKYRESITPEPNQN